MEVVKPFSDVTAEAKQSVPVPETMPVEFTRRHWVEPVMPEIVRLVVVALPTERPVPTPVVKASVGNVPVPDAEIFVVETLARFDWPVTVRVAIFKFPVPVALENVRVLKVEAPVTASVVAVALPEKMEFPTTCKLDDGEPVPIPKRELVSSQKNDALLVTVELVNQNVTRPA